MQMQFLSFQYAFFQSDESAFAQTGLTSPPNSGPAENKIYLETSQAERASDFS